MMKFQFNLDMGDGPMTITTNLMAEVAWERKFKVKLSDVQSGKAGFGAEDMAYLAYETLKSQKVVVPAVFDDFLRRLQHFEFLGGDNARPTEEALPDGT